jgi:hypothetical protein
MAEGNSAAIRAEMKTTLLEDLTVSARRLAHVDLGFVGSRASPVNRSRSGEGAAGGSHAGEAGVRLRAMSTLVPWLFTRPMPGADPRSRARRWHR